MRKNNMTYQQTYQEWLDHLDVYPGGVDTNFRTNDRPDYLT